MRNLCTFVLALSVLAAARPALAADYVFTIDSSQSSVLVTAELIEFGLDDSDTSTVGGAISAALTPDGGPFSQIHITGLDVALLQQIDIFLDGNIFQGDIIATGNGLALLMDEETYGLPGPPAAVDGVGDFNQTGNLVQGAGVISYTGSGLIFGLLGSGSINLLDYPPAPVDLGGNVVDDGDTVVLTMPIHAVQSYDVQGIATVIITISGTLVATAPSQGGAPIPGDLDGNGCVSQSDLGILLADFGCTAGVGNCPGDTDGDGDTDQSDLGVLLGNFGVGC